MKPHYAAKISLILLSLTAAASGHAQLTILSNNQSVSVSGWVSDGNGNVTQNYSHSQTQSFPTPGFAGNLSGNANGQFWGNAIFSGSTATQNSSLTSSQLFFSGSVETTQSFPAPAGHLYSDAYSSFLVTFSVSIPTAFTLTDNQHNWDMVDVGETFSLSSSTGGSIFSGPQINGSAIGQYFGMLEPDQIYTFEVSLGTRDFLQPDISQNFDVCLTTTDITPAPEPSAGLLLGSAGIVAGLLKLGQKRQARTPAL